MDLVLGVELPSRNQMNYILLGKILSKACMHPTCVFFFFLLNFLCTTAVDFDVQNLIVVLNMEGFHRCHRRLHEAAPGLQHLSCRQGLQMETLPK